MASLVAILKFKMAAARGRAADATHPEIEDWAEILQHAKFCRYTVIHVDISGS